MIETSQSLLPTLDDLQLYWKNVAFVSKVYEIAQEQSKNSLKVDPLEFPELRFMGLFTLYLGGLSDETIFTDQEVETGYRVYTGKSKLPGSYRSSGPWPEL